MKISVGTDCKSALSGTDCKSALSGRKGEYKQGREFDKDGKPVKDIDHTDHGRPSAHPDNPHQHRYIPNSTGGTPQRSKIPEPISHN